MNRCTALTIALLALGLHAVAPASGAAQAPPPEADADAPDRWAFAVDLSFSGSAGNEDLIVFAGEARMTHLRTELFEFEAGGRMRYGRSDGEVVARSAFGDVSFDLYPEEAWSPFVFGTLERDRFRKLDVRANGGAGLKHTFWRRDASTASFSLAGLFSYRDYALSIDSAIEELSRTARWSSRFKAEHAFRDGVRISQVAFYQPLWNDADDYLVDATTRIEADLTERTALVFRYQFRRNSRPPPDVEADDHLLEVGLHLAF